MAIEYEVRILDISLEEIIARIEKLGAYKVGNFHQKIGRAHV